MDCPGRRPSAAAYLFAGPLLVGFVLAGEARAQAPVKPGRVTPTTGGGRGQGRRRRCQAGCWSGQETSQGSKGAG